MYKPISVSIATSGMWGTRVVRMVRSARDVTGKGEAEMKPNEIAKRVCNRDGHKIMHLWYSSSANSITQEPASAEGIFCQKCGMSLEDIRGEDSDES